MIRRFAATAAVAVTLLASPAMVGAAMLGSTASASVVTPAASTYPTKAVQGTVSRATALSGMAVTFGGGGFKPLTTITITSVVATTGVGGKGSSVAIPASVLETIHADAAGAFSVVISLGKVGVNTLVATGLNVAGKLISITSIVTVMPFSTLSLGSVGNQGYRIGPQLWLLAAGVAAIGAALLVLVSRRRPVAHA